MTDATTRTTPRLSRSARRTQLMAAAKTVFVTQGYHAAAMDDIAVSARASANPFSTNTSRQSSSCICDLLGESADEMVRLVRAALAAPTRTTTSGSTTQWRPTSPSSRTTTRRTG